MRVGCGQTVKQSMDKLPRQHSLDAEVKRSELGLFFCRRNVKQTSLILLNGVRSVKDGE